MDKIWAIVTQFYNKLCDIFDPSKEHCKERSKYIFFLVEIFGLAIILGNIGPLLVRYINIGDSNYSLIIQHFLAFLVIPILVYGFIKGIEKVIEGQDNYIWGLLWLVMILILVSMTSSELLYTVLFLS